MILFARLLVRLVSFLLVVGLAIVGLVVAVFCISTGSTGLSLTHLAALVSLPDLRDTVGPWLDSLEAPGTVALIAGAAGLAAMLLGGLLLTGLLVPRRERLVQLSSDEHGELSARRRPLAQVAQALTEQVRGVTDARVRARPRRHGGGRLSVRAKRSRPVEPGAVRSAVEQELTDLTDPFRLKARIDVARDAPRVE